MFSVLFYVLSFFVIIFLFFIITPITLVINVRRKNQTINNYIQIKFLFISYKFKFNRISPPKSKGEKKPTDTKIETHCNEEDIKTLIPLVKNLLYPSGKLAKSLLKKTRINNISLDLEFGLKDPFITGLLCGYLYSLTAILKQLAQKSYLGINPNFNSDVFGYKGIIIFQIQIYKIIPGFVSFFLNRDLWKSIWKILMTR
ncbi:DUF2953 domain-containing protein [Methanosalsum natronophilum]|uniref:DUF2953 domain-containing protein n=1 Tax=Methanosalsum natronophilum TaxID=768733 RepID=A0A3R8CBT9_9EURY|nr:MAG: DUF2953 domain-containing protein [Methanosalsum natronophilum]